MKVGDKVKYTGKGFLGFLPSNASAEFIRYVGRHDAEIWYNGSKVLIFKYAIEKEVSK